MLMYHHNEIDKEYLIILATQLYDFMDSIKNVQQETYANNLDLLLRYASQELIERKGEKYLASMQNDFETFKTH